MSSQFDRAEAKKFLLARNTEEKQQEEDERKVVLQKVISTIQQKYKGLGFEVFLVGSILRPYHFSTHSDIDIVLRNFSGDRFQIWTELEELFVRDVEVLLYESCSFKEFVEAERLKVI